MYQLFFKINILICGFRPSVHLSIFRILSGTYFLLSNFVKMGFILVLNIFFFTTIESSGVCHFTKVLNILHF